MEGIGWVSYENLKRITRAHPEHDFYFIFDRPYGEEFIFGDNVHPIVAPPQARHPFLYMIWFEWTIPRILRKTGADVFFSPDSYLSLRSDVPQIAIFHDLNFEHRPKDVPFFARHYYRYFFPKFARKAAKIIAVSEFTKQDIVKQYHIPAGKIRVIYNGANEQFAPVEKSKQQAIREKYTNGAPYFVFVGAFNPRKNLSKLFKAFDLFKSRNDSPVRLLVIGEKMYWTKEIEEAYRNMQFREQVVFTGRLQMKKLTAVIGSALAMTYVSFLEGFGIPIVEAFRAQVPVITSNVTSMPEVAGDAALLVNPEDENEIARAMEQISKDEALRNRLIAKGTQRKNDFSWDKSAQQMWEELENILAGRR